MAEPQLEAAAVAASAETKPLRASLRVRGRRVGAGVVVDAMRRLLQAMRRRPCRQALPQRLLMFLTGFAGHGCLTGAMRGRSTCLTPEAELAVVLRNAVRLQGDAHIAGADGRTFAALLGLLLLQAKRATSGGVIARQNTLRTHLTTQRDVLISHIAATIHRAAVQRPPTRTH